MGGGLLAEAISSLGNDVIGLDISDEARKQAKSRGIEVILHNLDEAPYPFQDEFFDAIIASNVLEHLFFLDVCLSECYRILKAGGELFVVSPNVVSWKNRIKFLLGKFDFPLNNIYLGHIRYFTIHSLKKELNNSGFQVCRVIGLGGATWLTKKVYKYFPHFSDPLFIEARKP